VVETLETEAVAMALASGGRTRRRSATVARGAIVEGMRDGLGRERQQRRQERTRRGWST